MNYLWNTGPTTASLEVSPTSATVYTVTGTYTATGCSSSKTASVDVFTPTITISPTTTDICRGTTVTLNASAALTSYTWGANGNTIVITPSNVSTSTIAVSPTATTIYTLITRSKSSTTLHCVSDRTVQVNAHSLPTVSIIASRNPICQFDELTEMTVKGADSYTWSGSLGSTSLVSTTLDQTTTYTVTGSNVQNCQGKAVITISVGICYGVDEIQGNQINVDLFPNPSTGEFNVRSDVDINLNIINEVGQTVKVISLSASNNHTLEINDLSSGIYFVIGSNSEGTVKKKMIISR